MNIVRGGTPVMSGPGLCDSCRNSQIIKGRGLHELKMYCNAEGTVPLPVTFPVVECNAFDDKRSVALWEMEKVAWKFAGDKQSNSAGFLPPKKWKEKFGDND